MNEDLLKQIERCKDCLVCNEVCDTYIVSKDDLKGPNKRLKIAEKIFLNDSIREEWKKSLYTCTLCGLCNLKCPQDIQISEIIHSAKKKLVEKGEGPLEVHKSISEGIIKYDNSVNEDSNKRLDWLPEVYKTNEQFEEINSNTLLFLGCMSSFKVKESALSAYKILKSINYDFKILRNEPCCGEYLYSSGQVEEAIKYFSKVNKIFRENNIKTLIVTCAGCLYAFKNVYPKYIDDFNTNVKHITQILNKPDIYETLELKNKDDTVIYHDACRMGRKLNNVNIYTEPRKLIEKTGAKLKELEKNRENSMCCGAGSGIRGVDKDLCINIGSKILEESQSEAIVSSCPLCVFNFRYINFKKNLNKKISYITDYIIK